MPLGYGFKVKAESHNVIKLRVFVHVGPENINQNMFSLNLH